MVKTKTTRVRGFAPYTPRGYAKQVIGWCGDVLEQYRVADILPITLRQLFYRLVVLYAFPKTEADYKKLGEILNRARYAGMISMSDIRDDGFAMTPREWFDDETHYWDWMVNEADSFRLDRQRDQQWRLVLWCEAAGMRPQLERVCRPYGVPVASSGGFDSTSTKHRIGNMLSKAPSMILHIGDYDPSGVHMFGSLDEDVTAFCEHYGGDVEFHRLAVLSEHIEEYDLPTAPPKATDTRSFDDTRTVQAEALDPATLSQLVEAAITGHIDLEIYANVLAAEEELRTEIQEKLSGYLDN